MAAVLRALCTSTRRAFVPELVVVLLLVATAASAQSFVDQLLSPGEARGKAWCSDARGASADGLVTLWKSVEAHVGVAERAEQQAKESVTFHQDELRNAENTKKQKDFELARLEASLGATWSSNPAILAAEQSRARADEALAFRRGLIARTARLREELDRVRGNPDPTSTRSIDDVNRDIEMAERVLKTAREKVSDQELDDASRSALAAVADERTRQGGPALDSALKAWMDALRAIAPAEEALSKAELAVPRASELANRARANRDEAAGCIAVRRAQLNSPDTSAPATPANLPGWAGQVSGSWEGSCLFRGAPSGGARRGRFTWTFDGRGNFKGSFVEDGSASISGNVEPNGALLGRGSILIDDIRMAISIGGALSRKPSGGLSASGVLNTNDGQGLTCGGQWSS